MPHVRAALVQRYPWFIHVTPAVFLQSIRDKGLEPNRDKVPPADVAAVVGVQGRIVCLHPLGAALCPRGAVQTLILPMGASNPKVVSLALSAEYLPTHVGLDWSFEWACQCAEIENILGVEDAALHAAHAYGSVVTYDQVPAEHLRIFCKDNSPANPLSWTALLNARPEDIILHE
jgi:hypothetical protein